MCWKGGGGGGGEGEEAAAELDGTQVLQEARVCLHVTSAELC